MTEDRETYLDMSIDDEDQLQPEDTLDDRGVDDVLDEGFSPPDREPANLREDGTPTLEDRLDAEEPELAVLDMQIANMGGVAVSIDLRLEAAAGRLPQLPILLLLDREADRHIAQRADADSVLVKPVDAGQLRRAIKRLLSPVSPVGGNVEGEA